VDAAPALTRLYMGDGDDGNPQLATVFA